MESEESIQTKVDVAVLGEHISFPVSTRVTTNRFVKAAMSECLATWNGPDINNRGIITPNLIKLYETWSGSEVGLLISGNVLVHREHLEAIGNIIVEDDRDLEGLTQLATVAKKNGSLFIGQVSHPGRQCPMQINPHPVGPSDITFVNALGMENGKPHALSEDEIKEIVQRFGNTSRILERAGWDGVQIHAAHGYLLSQFLSPRVNNREDKYGGSLQNRARILMECIQEVRSTVSPNFIVGVKLNSGDFTEKGFSLEDCGELAKMLEESGMIDFIELSGGTYENELFETKTKNASTLRREAFFLEFADSIRPHMQKTPLCVTGGFRTAKAMIQAIENKSCDLIGLARPLCQEPLLVKQILSGEVDGAKKTALRGKTAGLLQLVVAKQHIEELGMGKQPSNFAVSPCWSESIATQGRILALIYRNLTWAQVKLAVRKSFSS